MEISCIMGFVILSVGISCYFWGRITVAEIVTAQMQEAIKFLSKKDQMQIIENLMSLEENGQLAE